MVPCGCDPLGMGSDGRLGSNEMVHHIKNALQAVSSNLLNKATQTATDTVGWIFLTVLKANIDQTLCNAVLVHNVQRHLEELEQCIFVFVRARTQGPEEPSISNNEPVSDSDDGHYETKDGDDGRYETVGPCLAARPIVSMRLQWAQWGPSWRGPQCDCVHNILTTYSSGIC